MKKKRLKYISTEFIVAVILIIATASASFFVEHMYWRNAALVGIFGIAVLYFSLATWSKQRMAYIAAELLQKSDEKIDKYINAVSIPTAITNKKGRILYHNPAFLRLAEMQCDGRNIRRIFPQIDKPEWDRKMKVGDVSYYKEIKNKERKGREYVIYRLIDTKNSYESAELYKIVMATVCHMQIDNFDDLLRGIPQKKHSEVEAEVDRMIDGYTSKIQAVYQKYDRDKYLIVFERRHLNGILSRKFEILSDVKRIDTGVRGLVPTMSLGLGVGRNPEAANTNALNAMEMALGRGGDQAVMKDDEGYHFFGGVQQGREKQSRVKSRMFASALRNLMEQCSRVFIMGHDISDMDCIGSALGILACARKVGKNAVIVMNKANVSIQPVLDEMKRNPIYKDLLISPVEAEGLMDGNAMVVVVDTQIASLTAAPQLLKQSQTTVVIDHHVRGTNSIEGSTLFLHEPYASSASEMVTEIAEYFSGSMELKPLEAEALLAGITVDTKGFSFKTGTRTFEAAAYLRRKGADTTKIRHLFQDDLETFTGRARVVENAKVMEDGIAISICPPNVKSPSLLAAQAADALIGIRGIHAAFVLCEQNGEVMISGRSIGDVNVQRIMEKMGGGGHATIAGAQIKNRGVDDVVKELKEKIKEYEKEV